MTYEEQLKVEQLNKEIINNIKENVGAEVFIDFYLCHNQKETMAEFGLRTTKQLTKILKDFNYDFSKPKSSLFKGKASPRSHESYIEGGKKSGETQKENWQNKSDQEKSEWSIKQQLAHSTEEFKNKIKQINNDYQARLTPEDKAAIKLKKQQSNLQTWKEHHKEILEKAYITRKLKNSFNSSKPEDLYYIKLIKKFGEDNIYRNYDKDPRYPFACDFYIKPLDLFIELNLHWSHGGHLFNEQNEEDINKLNIWKEKAKTSAFYKKSIETWTIRDPLKMQTAIANKLNYKVYYLEEELSND